MTYSELIAFFLRHRRTVLMFLLLWSAFAAFEIASDWYKFSSAGWSFVTGRYAAQSALIFYPWFLISLAIGAIAWRKPRLLDNMRGYAVHAVLAIAVGLSHLSVIVGSFAIFFPRMFDRSSFAALFAEQFLNWFHFELLVYFAVLFVWHMVLYRERPISYTNERQRVVGRVDGEVHIATPESIDWIEAANNHTIAHICNRQIKVRETLKSLQNRLGAHQFVRVHRSALVNVDRLRQIEGTQLVMANGARVACSRSGKKALKQIIQMGSE